MMEVKVDPSLLLELTGYGENEEMAEEIVENEHKLCSHSLAFREAVREIKERLVPRWHFTMLNDITRNSLYFKAISETLKHCSGVVLDIGSGTGILSLMAVKGGAKHVYGYEQSHVMANLSRQITTANQMQDKVTIINAHTRDFNTSHDPLSHSVSRTRISLVVMEIFDAGLIGEHVIPSLRHVWAELLKQSPATHIMGTPPDDTPPRIIPCKAMVYICAIQSIEIRRKARLLNPVLKAVTSGKGVCLLGTCKLSSNRTELVQEPYHSENLSAIKGGVVYLTEVKEYHTFHFTDPQVPTPHGPICIDLPVVKSGVIDAVCLWFDLHLDSNGRRLSTSPHSLSRWDQAIYPTNTGVGSNHQPLVVTSGTHVTVSVSCTDTAINIDNIGVSHGDSDRQPSSCELETVFVERSHLYRLNDSSYIDGFIDALKTVLHVLKRDYNNEDIRVMEVTDHGLSLFAVLLDIILPKDNRYILVTSCSQLYIPLLQQLAVTDMIQFVTSIPPTLVNTTWDVVILSDLITPQGTLSHNTLTQLNKINLIDCILVPWYIEVMVVGVASSELRALSCVLGSIPTMGLDIARFVNKYQISHVTDIDLCSVEHTRITETRVGYGFDLRHISTQDVRFETIPLRVACDGVLTGIVYWFILHLHGSQHIISTGPTPSSENHWHQSLFMLPEDKTVYKDQVIPVALELNTGYINITTDN